MMIFSACDSGALPSRLAASRPCQTRSTMAGSNAGYARNAHLEAFYRVLIVG